MNRLFGTKKNVQAPTPIPVNNAPEKTYDLVEQQQKLENRVDDSERKLNEMNAEIQQLYMQVRSARGSNKTFIKQKLLQKLKRRKMYSNQMKQYSRNQMILDNVAFTHENIQNNIDMVQAMKGANQAQKIAMKGMNIDNLEDMRDEMDDMMWQTQEINDALDRNYDLDVDEDDLDDELNEIEEDLKLNGLMNNSNPQLNQFNQNAMKQ